MMDKLKIVFLGAKAIGSYCLQYLIQHQDNLNIEILAIGTKINKALDSNESVYEIASKNKIKIISEVNEIPICDYIISVQYHSILKKEHIAKAGKMAINLHMAPLPEYRGCNAMSFAIWEEKNFFGTTLHILDEGIDSGDILFERRFEIDNEIWVQELYEKTLAESKILFADNIGKIFSGAFIAIPQIQLIADRGSSFHLRDEISNLKIIDERWGLDKKKKLVRATYMPGFEAPYAIVEGEKKYYTKANF